MEKKVSFCFQHQAKHDYFNLEIENIYGKKHNITSEDIQDIEDDLKIIWGHLLDKPKLPTPPGFPRPPG